MTSGLHPLPAGTQLTGCALCGAAVPMTGAQQSHLRWHTAVNALAGLAPRIAQLEIQVAELEAAAAEEARLWMSGTCPAPAATPGPGM